MTTKRSYSEADLSLSRKKRFTLYRVIIFLACAALFIGVLPTFFILLSQPLEGIIEANTPLFIRILIAVPFIATGIWVIVWTVWMHWKAGRLAPAPFDPTQKFIVNGPYRFCRNPIQLGILMYYFGIGCLASSLTAGLTCFLITLFIGGAYHYCVEETELEQKFGPSYINYKKHTPFLFPDIRRFFK